MEKRVIVVDNATPTLEEFKDLMCRTDHLLNVRARKDESLFMSHNGQKLEEDVCDALRMCARGTAFSRHINLVSGARFPDIVAKGYYGVEVKSTISDRWTSIGSSILETTRIDGVERIYLTFGKLGSPVEFISRPYEQCMEDIAVTHYPRYKINMKLVEGETIFDKMGIPYDELRQLDNPVAPVAEYYRSQLNVGESLWWTGSNIEDTAVSPKVRLWSATDRADKEQAIAHGLAYFPEVVRSDYTRYVLWLVTNMGIVNPNIRDGFSAGGQVSSPCEDIHLPAVFGRIKRYCRSIERIILSTPLEILSEYWQVKSIEENRIMQWCSLIKQNTVSVDKVILDRFLKDIFL